MLLLLFQIFLTVGATVFGLLFTGCALINAWHIRVNGGISVWMNLLVGVPLLSVAAWLPFAFGWIGV